MESLVPPLPQPDAERAAEALDLITQCFQAIAEEEARQKEIAEKGKSKSRSLFSFGGDSKHSGCAEGEGDTVPGQRAFIYDDEEEEEGGVEEEQDTGDSDAQEGDRTDKTAEIEQDTSENNTQAQPKLDLHAGVKQNSQVDVDNAAENEEEEESAARLANWDQQRDAIATMEDVSGSAPQMMRSSSRADSVRAVHLADDFKYW